MPLRKRNAFRLKLRTLDIRPPKRKTAGTEPLRVHDAMARRPAVTRILMERISYGTAQIAVSEERRNLRIRGNLSPGNKPDSSIDSF